MKKSLLIILVFFTSFISYAQEPPKMPKYNAKNQANIFYYDLGEALDKSKIKKDEIGNATKRALRIYNDNVKKISFLNFQKLQDIELLVNSMGDQVYKDRDVAMKVGKQIRETILPIRDSIDESEKELNKTLEGLLSKKQYKKWLKHQRNKKKELLPEQPKNNNNNQTQSPMRSGRGRGMGRGGF